MSKVELLAPAGNFEALQAAIQGGCDAVFLGGKMFGARASANNFSIEEMQEAVKLAHLYGVKIHVTLNTLIQASDIEACMEYVGDLYQIGVDALIVQDLGIMDLIQHQYPDFELHASTQMHVHSLQGVHVAKQMGLKRVVVARETPLTLIKEMCKQGIEIEVFVQGAYCVSYSGQCLMSANIGGRSGNQGACAQTCRLPFELVDQDYKKIKTQGEYLLSLKDLNALKLIPELIEAGVRSFKIEGRMKRPEYVYVMTSIYRRAIDAYYAHTFFDVNEAVLNEMRKVFNRGFTEGHLKELKGSAIHAWYRPNHQGIVIGKVIGLSKDKMQIQLSDTLRQKDGIRILSDQNEEGFIVNYLYKQGQLVNQASHEVIELNKIAGVKANDVVVKTSDSLQLNEIEKAIQATTRKVKINGTIRCFVDQPFSFTVQDEIQTLSRSFDLIEKADQTPTGTARIEEQIRKTGNTVFQFEKLCIEGDGLGIVPISKLNEWRRSILEELKESRESVCRNICSLPFETHSMKQTNCLAITVSTLEQYEALKNYPIEMSVIGEQLKDLHPENYSYPRVMKNEYQAAGIVSEIGGLSVGHTASSYLNVYNGYTAYYLSSWGIKKIALSYECTIEQSQNLIKQYQAIASSHPNLEKVVYVRKENMVNQACVVNSALLDNDKQNCSLCKNKQYYLKDLKNELYPLRGDDDCNMHVYHSKVMNDMDLIPTYKSMGITNFRCVFTFESGSECIEIVEKFLKWSLK